MEIKVVFLGPARDLAGVPSTSMEVPHEIIAASVRSMIVARFPQFKAALPTMRLAINQAFVSEDHVLSPDDEVALIPPVSGG